MSASEIANRVRAFQPWPGTYANFRAARLTIWRANDTPEPALHNASAFAVEPGTILTIDESGITVVCSGRARCSSRRFQVEGKRRVSAREFANGARLKPGDRIN